MVWIERTPRRVRLIFNTWRAPFPYLLHRWSIESTVGWCAGYFRRSSAQAWIDGYNSLD